MSFETDRTECFRLIGEIRQKVEQDNEKLKQESCGEAFEKAYSDSSSKMVTELKKLYTMIQNL